MRKTIAILACIFTSIACFTNADAQSTLIHYWHFNGASPASVYTPSITPIPADYTDLPGTNAVILYSKQPGVSSSYSTYIDLGFASSTADYDTVNLRMSQPAGNYIRVHNPSDSMELLFYTPSTHFNNLVFTFGTSRPANGMTHQNYDYSVDSGTTWITTGLSILTDSVWSTFQRITLTTTNTAVNNNPRLVFRVKWSGSITGTAGNNRFDNVSLDGDTTTAATQINATVNEQGNYILYPNPAGSTVNLVATLGGVKHIVITNLLGQKVYEASEEGKHFSISTTALNAGCYFISINEEGAASANTMRFIKL